jgi:uncharacterized protein
MSSAVKVFPDTGYVRRATVAWKLPGKQRPAKPRYKVDLSGQQADCAANYLRLRKILHELHHRDAWLFDIGSGTVQGQLCVNVVDRAPYTTTLSLTQPTGPDGGAPVALKAPKLTVCMYHDADMAEVVGWENHRRLWARYDYPNRHMYQCDEKAQLNRFLAEWLTLCQAEGRVAFDLAAPLK